MCVEGGCKWNGCGLCVGMDMICVDGCVCDSCQWDSFRSACDFAYSQSPQHEKRSDLSCSTQDVRHCNKKPSLDVAAKRRVFRSGGLPGSVMSSHRSLAAFADQQSEQVFETAKRCSPKPAVIALNLMALSGREWSLIHSSLRAAAACLGNSMGRALHCNRHALWKGWF